MAMSNTNEGDQLKRLSDEIEQLRIESSFLALSVYMLLLRQDLVSQEDIRAHLRQGAEQLEKDERWPNVARLLAALAQSFSEDIPQLEQSLRRLNAGRVN